MIIKVYEKFYLENFLIFHLKLILKLVKTDFKSFLIKLFQKLKLPVGLCKT